MITGDTANEKTFQIKYKLWRISTDGRLTTQLFIKRGRGVELGTTEENPDSGRYVELLNQGPTDFKSSALAKARGRLRTGEAGELNC